MQNMYAYGTHQLSRAEEEQSTSTTFLQLPENSKKSYEVKLRVGSSCILRGRKDMKGQRPL